MGISTINGIPAEQWNERQRQWAERMAIRQPIENIDLRKLVNQLLTQHWQHECLIELTNPRFGNLQPKLTISWAAPGATDRSYLRHSRGPGTGTFWDVYGDDFHTPELALIQLSKAYPPPRVDCVIPTHGDD